ncbi:MAG: DUF6160 family protein [Pseudomonadota bacterium]
MTFRKLALASAVALVPTTGFAAMVEMEEGSMADITGQDGITLAITTPAITTDIYIHDKDGLAGAVGAYSVYSFDGAIVIDNFSYAGNMTITVDAGDNIIGPGATNPTLNINVSIPSATIITGNISVANSQRDDVASGWGINTQSATLLNTMTIALSGLVMNIQLGNEPQGNMIAVASTVTNGISINSFALRDANSGGMIGASNILIKDTGASANLQLSVNANATAAGLVIGVAQLGSTTGMDIRITDARVGTTTSAAIGDITIANLNLTGTTITLSGK